MADFMQMIVVLISEGRNFPKRSAFQLLFEAKFDGELLCTDGVPHVELPEVTQELAWQINKKNLHQHKLHRTPIKILCYALDTRTSAKEQIGYLVLDLKSAPDRPVKKWYHLLNTKYKKSKPELKVAIYIEPLDIPAGDPSLLSEKGPNSSEIDVTALKPELNDDDGVFQLGPPTRCKDIFVLSITVAFTGNLTNILPNTKSVSIDPQGFYFFYTLFDNDVMTERFLDIFNPKLTAERASVRIRTSLDVLRHFFNIMKPIEIHLCSGDISLGSAKIALAPLLKEGGLLATPSIHEGAYELVAPAKYQSTSATDKTEDKPLVGLQLQLRRETPLPPSQPDSGTCLTDRPISAEPPKKPTQTKADTRDSTTAEDYTNTFASETSSVKSPTAKSSKANQQSPVKSKSPSKNGGAAAVMFPSNPAPNSLTTTSENTRYSVQPHHYEFSLELKSIKNVVTDHHIYVYLRYRYPEFGSLAPYSTHPAVEVRRDMEQVLSNSFCAMDFSMSPGQLRETTIQSPFEIELWQYDQTAGNRCMGRAVLPLNQLINSKVHSSTLYGKPVAQQKMTSTFPVMCDGRRVADLTASFCLSDFGEVPAHLVVTFDEDNKLSTATNKPARQNTEQAPADPTESPEYQAALELEIWKESQEKQFEQQLKNKEFRLIAQLTEDFKRRDMERELLCKKKIAENNNMQQELQKMMNQLTKREAELVKREKQMETTETELKRAYEVKLVDLKESSRRLEEECDHKLKLSRVKTEDLEQQIQKLKNELTEAAMKYRDLENEFSRYKEQQHNKPEVKLQSEINLLTLEKVELERRLDACNKSKAHYKQQWGRALKENAKLKDQANEEARKYAQRQIQELELLKQRLFAAEERDILKTEKRELTDIKEELNRQQIELTKKDADSSPEKTTPTKRNEAMEEQLRRLQDERDSLLKTGVFNTEDEMIVELEKRIQAVIHSIDNS